MSNKVLEGKLRVPAIKNGSVIDHIPLDALESVVSLLGIFTLSDYPVTIGLNFKSEKLGLKGIIKIENRFFSPEEVSRLAVVAPNVVLNVIKEYEVVEKVTVTLPQSLIGVIKCPNPKCITNSEPAPSKFRLYDRNNGIMQCEYCTRKVKQGNIDLSQLI